MTNPYTYSIASDMPSGAVNLARLHKEIVASSIATTLVGIGVVSDVLTVEFTGDLSTGDKTILDNDATGPSGGLLAAHDNSAAPEVETIVTEADPEITAVNAKKGSKIVWGDAWYVKLDDGLSTNVALQGTITTDSGQAGGFLFNFAEYTTDPVTPIAGDLWIRNTASVRRLVFYDGTNKHAVVLTQE